MTIGAVVRCPVIVSGNGTDAVTVLCALGYWPVMIDAIDAFVYGACAIALVNLAAWRAKASMAGDVNCW